ncbi:hypothetical protein Tco_1400894 [Tanacetum coccineum]
MSDQLPGDVGSSSRARKRSTYLEKIFTSPKGSESRRKLEKIVCESSSNFATNVPGKNTKDGMNARLVWHELGIKNRVVLLRLEEDKATLTTSSKVHTINDMLKKHLFVKPKEISLAKYLDKLNWKLVVDTVPISRSSFLYHFLNNIDTLDCASLY